MTPAVCAPSCLNFFIQIHGGVFTSRQEPEGAYLHGAMIDVENSLEKTRTPPQSNDGSNGPISILSDKGRIRAVAESIFLERK